MRPNFHALAQQGELTNGQESEKELFMKYLPLVNATVQRMKVGLPPHVDTDDLIGAAIVGLLDAIRKYDPKRKETFPSFVALKVKCAILSELRGRDFLSRGVRQRSRLVEAGYERLEKELGREPTPEEVAVAVGMSLEELEEIEKLSSISLFSLNELKAIEGKEATFGILRDDRDDLEEQIYLDQLYWPLVEAIKGLDEKERLVLSLYYVEELTMKEIAEVLNVTESRVSQIHSKAIRRLRVKLRAKGLI